MSTPNGTPNTSSPQAAPSQASAPVPPAAPAPVPAPAPTLMPAQPTPSTDPSPSASPAPNFVTQATQPSQPLPSSQPSQSQLPQSSQLPQASQSLAEPSSHARGKDKEKDKDDKEDDEEDIFAAKREEEMARRDRSLAEFLVMLDGYKPLIPEEVTEYYLQRAGFECQDPRLKRLLSLSAQKFISDLSRDAFHFAKLRVNSTAAGRGRPASGVDRNRVVLTMDDLSLALGEHGVNVKKPDYYL